MRSLVICLLLLSQFITSKAQQPASRLSGIFPQGSIAPELEEFSVPIKSLRQKLPAKTTTIPSTSGNNPALRIQPTAPSAPVSPQPASANLPLQWLEETVIGRTTFDVQTNGSVSNRIVKNADGTISAAWNFSKQASPFNDRGTGYNYFDPNSTGLWINGWINPIGNTGPGLASINRTENTYRTGYTNIIVTPSGKEMSVAHSSTTNTMLLNRRAVKGTGAWTQLPNALSNGGASNFDTWAKGIADGDTIHLIWHGSGTSGTNVNGQNGPIFYSRSNDGGVTWPVLRTVIPSINSTFYRGWDADAYSIDAKNGTVVIVFGDYDTDVGIIKSIDGGRTWTKKIIQQFPIPLFNAATMNTDAYGPNGTGAPDGIADTLLSNGADAHALIDNSGMVHVWFSKMRVFCRTAGQGLSIFPNTDGLYYWNESMATDAYVLVAQSLDMNNDGILNLPTGGACSSPYGYFDGGLTQMPSAGIDVTGNLYVTYQSICELCDTNTATLSGSQARRHIYMITSTDNGVTWTTPKDIVANVSYGGNGELEEAVYASMARTVDSKAYVLYQRDDQPGNSILVSGGCEQYNNNANSDIILAKVDASFARNTSVRVIINVNSPIKCFGGTTTVSVIGAGGTPPYSGVGTYSRTAGTFTFTVADALGITSSASVTITQPSRLIATSSATSILCNGDSAQVTVSASGGTPPYEGTGIFNRAGGPYTFTVLDTLGCSTTLTGTIGQPSAIVVSATPGTIACNGGTTTVVVSATGGVPPYTGTGTFTTAAGSYAYVVSDANGCRKSVNGAIVQPTTLTASSIAGTINCNGGSTSVTVSGNGGTQPYTGTGTFSRNAGSYIYSILDANGCAATTSGSITQPTAVSPLVNTTPCNTVGGSDGTASVIVTGGTPPYSYSWSNGATTSGLTNITAGTYTVTVSDSRGCTATSSAVVGDPNCNLQVTVSSSNIPCFGGTSNITVSAVGGIGPYTGVGSFVRSAGPYSFTVVDSIGCSATRSGIISQPSVLSVTATAGAIACNGDATTVNVVASGGTPPYSGTGTFTRNAGAYSYVVNDANNCSASVNGNITQPTLLNATAAGASVSCFGGSTTINVSAAGGTSPYTGTGVFTLPAGSYSYTITDNNGCTDTAAITVTQPVSALVASTATGSIPCNGGTTTVNVSATGGTLPYTGTGSYVISAGNYNYVVTDARGCVSVTTGVLNQPAVLTASATAGVINCFGGTTNLLVSAGGGTTPYTGTGSFLSSAGPYNYTISDANGCSVSISGSISQPPLLTASSSVAGNVLCFGGSTTVNVTAGGGTVPYSGTGAFTRGAGNYTYTVTDNLGCTATTTGIVNQPSGALDAIATPGIIACNGGATNIAVAATGGTTPYTGTGIFSATAGPYSYIVTDANGCRDTVSGSLTQPTILIASATSGSINCNGGSTNITVTASGGTIPYTGTGAFSRNAGTYIFTVTDSRNCVSTISVTLAQPSLLLASSSAGTISCNGGTTNVTVSASGGTLPYTGTGTFTRTAGAYSYTITDAAGCTATTSGSIVQPTPLSVNALPGSIACNGGTTAVTVNASGGTAPYSGTGTFTRPAGSYSFIVSDANGCTATANGTITQPTALIVASNAGMIPCFGGTTSVTVTASGGVPPYNGTGSFTRSAGPYTFTVTDANNCVANTTGNISQPTLLSAGSSAGSIPCFGSTTTLTISATGGTSPYSGTGSFSRPAGSYTYTVTDANGCTSSVSGSLTQPTGLSATITTTNATTVGGSNGTASASTSGGTPPYTYSWSSGATSSTATALNAGSYTVIITDANSCTTSASGSVGDPSCNILISVTGTSINCFGGTTVVSVTATGGTSPYSGTGNFTRSVGAYTYTVTDAIGCSAIISGTVTQPSALSTTSQAGSILCNGGSTSVSVSASGGTIPYIGTGTFTRSAGTYSYTVTDSKGCTAISTGTISQPTNVIANSSYPPIACNGGNTSITVIASGGTAPYTGTGLFIRSAGSYTYTITDANGCTQTTSGTITQPSQLTITVNSSAILCFGGNSTIVVSASGGTAPYSGTGSFLRNAGTYFFLINDTNGCSATTTGTITQPNALISSTSATPIACFGGNSTVTVNASGGTGPYNGTGNFLRTAGNYSYTVTDANGCTAVTNGTIGQPSALLATSISGQIACNGGTTIITVSASGGTSPYSGTGAFTRSAGAYSLTVTDANGCTTTAAGTISQPSVLNTSSSYGSISCHGGTTTINVSASGGTAPYTGTGSFIRSAGNYIFTVTDLNGCTAIANGTVPQPVPLSVIASSSNISCFGGTATLVVSANGGTSPYSGTGNYSVSAGPYAYTVTDANGCTASITGSVVQPLLLTATVTTTGATTVGGNNGTATANCSGGTTPYSYLWSNNSISQTAIGLTAGNYTVTITDANGCSTTATASVGDPTCNITLTATGTSVLCYGGSTTVVLTATGGTAPYNGTGNFTRSAGPFSFSVSDAFGCSASISGTITQPSPLNASSSSGSILCNGGTTSVVVIASGGNSPYSGTGTFVTTAGSYSYAVTDANGCTATASGTIQQPSALLPASSTGTISCFGGNSAVTVTASGGTAPYTGIGVFTTVAGNYTYTVIDANGCSAVANGSINQPPQLLATSGFNPIPCTGALTSVSVTAGGGTAPYAGIGNFLRTAGPYSFIVTDANGCTTTASGNIPQPALLTVTAQSGIILCNSGTTSIIINAAGGTSPYNGTGTFTVPAGNYSYTVTDANGCTASTSQSISHPTSLIATVTTGSILCFGGNTTVSVSATGGTAPYTGTGLFTRLAGVYSLPITDANGCSTTVSGTLIQPTALVTNSTQGNISCSGGSTTVLVSATGGTAPYLGVGIYNVGVGAYSYQVTDANGCTSNVVGSISQPTQLTASLSSSSINCFGGQSVITINASGGTAPYSGTGTFSRPSGSYTFNISDANGCSTTSSVLVSQPNPLSASVNTTPATTVGGNNGSATANVSGGSPAYTYRWSNNSTSATATGLTAGIYTVTVTDANGCTVTAAASVGDPSCNLTLIITGTDIPCFGGTTAVNVVASGGTPPYTGAGSFVRSAGPFSTTVTDAIGCSAVVSSTIHQPAQLIAAASTSNIGCYGGTSSVNISAVGGTIPYSGTGLFNRNAGAFSYIVEDANGCSDTVSGNILQPAAISISSSSGNIACNGGSTTVIINASGGTLPYSGIGTFTRTAGNHPFTVTDGNSCSQTINVQLNQPDRLIADAGISGDYCRATLISLGGNPTAQGGTSSYTYQWTPSAGLNNNTSSNPTTIINQSTVYQLAVTDANGCRATDSIVMRATGPVTPTISSTGFCNGSGSLLVSNADPSYSFTWNTGESSRSITAFTPGTYIVTASDSQGCFASGSIQISTAPNCDGYLLISSPLSVNLFDTIGVVVSIRNADRIFSVFTAVGFDTTLLRFVGGTPYRPFGSSTNVSVAVQQGSNVQFGVYQSFGSPAFNGSADLYLIRFVVDPLDSTINLNTNLTPYLSTLFTLSNINVTDSAGIRPASFQQNTSDSTTTFIYYFVPVWPGDLDNNNRSDVADVLPIGYFFNATGPSRQNASTAWIGQPAPLWGIDRSALNGSAYKTFADANGDGFINLSDKSPILQHIGSQHARMARPPFRSIESFAPPRTQPVLSINLADSSLLRSSLPYTEQAVISIGDAIIPYVDLYGVAFDLYFDPAFVNTSSIVVNFNGSVFGNLNSDFIQVTDTSDISSGRLSIGMTRFNNSPVTAFGGPLVSVGFPITASAPNGWFVVDMNPITANDEVGFRHSVVDQDDSLLISGLVSAGTAPEPFSFDVFPNPTTGSFTLRMNQSFMKPDYEIRVISMIGQTVFETLLTEQITSIKLGESVTNGLYVVLINDNSGKVIGQRRVVLQR